MEASTLLGLLAACVQTCEWAEGGSAAPSAASGSSGARAGPVAPTKAAYLESLRSELAASGLLDAWAGCYLALAQAEDGGHSPLLRDFTGDLLDLSKECSGGLPCGPALGCLLLGYLAQLSAALDGGPGCGPGMPDVGLLSQAGGRLRPGAAGAAGTPNIRMPSHILQILRRQPDLAPPPSAVTGFGACLRLAEAALRACGAVLPAAPSPHQAPAAGRQLHRARLSRADGGTLVFLGLSLAAILLLDDEGPAGPAGPVRPVWLLRMWRDLAAAVAVAVAEGEGGPDAKLLSPVMSMTRRYTKSVDSRLGARPCLKVRAMPRAGFLPAFERLMARVPDEAACCFDLALGVQVLAHGPRDQVFQLLQSAAAGLAEAGAREASALLACKHASALEPLAARRLAHSACAAGVLLDLAEAASYGLVHTLPLLAEAVRLAAWAGSFVDRSGQRAGASAGLMAKRHAEADAALEQAALCLAAAAAAAEAAEAADEAAAAAAAARAEDWKGFLLQDVQVPSLLAAACLMADPEGSANALDHLALALELAAVVMPEALRAPPPPPQEAAGAGAEPGPGLEVAGSPADPLWPCWDHRCLRLLRPDGPLGGLGLAPLVEQVMAGGLPLAAGGIRGSRFTRWLRGGALLTPPSALRREHASPEPVVVLRPSPGQVPPWACGVGGGSGDGGSRSGAAGG
ncbi:hypothetical protein HYH03_009272 [Edaphochlamys debaryana]|uniref:Uncharacterized protein n=1 Tax=Edaphochlamys debaryana TaxID=47281 RepID=A0A835Y1G0_9CHLO|nr:hypothetical protein HYH03_009272 [Edaphochlamys debaryana]|eukprot:KAG2492321.1 hypothetical protein HYH03_009272 [Edaphochlamys debaryana]